MSFLLLFITLISFVLFFYGIGLRYLGFLPFIFFIVLLGYYFSKISIKINTKKILEKYGVLIAWITILLGISGILYSFGLGSFWIIIGLIIINIFLWVFAYIINYIDGQFMFKLTYFISIVILLFYSAFHISGSDFMKLLEMLWGLHLGICAFITFILGIWKPIKKSFLYEIFFFSITLFILIILQIINNLYIAIFVDIIFLTIIIIIIQNILKYKNTNITSKQKENISIRKILAGETILEQKTIVNQNLILKINIFLKDIPNWTKKLLEITNILLILLLIITFISNISLGIQESHQILFWLTIIAYIFNVIILKKIGYTSILQKTVVFLIINFAIYTSLFAIFKNNISNIAGRGILRNISSCILIFFISKIQSNYILKKHDYIFWIINIFIAMIVNIILLIKSKINGQLIFSLVFIYIGIQGMLLFYAIKYIKNNVNENKNIVDHDNFLV